jgi:succinyl-diaminopimelate desuccinylase
MDPTSAMQPSEILSKVQDERLLDLCSDLIRLNTVNPPGDELEAAEFLGRILREDGVAVDVVRHTPTRASLVARLQGSGRVPPLVYCGHLDVMPVGEGDWLYDPFAGRSVDGRLWGRGSSDMKSGVAAMIEAARVLVDARLPLKGDLVLLLTSDEEGEGLGAYELAGRADLAPAMALIIPEPTGNDVIVAEKGQLWLEITTHGKAAHGSMPHLGRNAIMMMVCLLSKLEELQVPHVEHPLLGGFTSNVGTMHGGLRTNVVPERCVVTMDLRTVPGQEHRAVLAQVERLISELCTEVAGFSATVRILSDLCPVETSLQDPAVQSFCDVVAAVIGRRPVPRGVPYTTDAPILVPALQAPLIVCGPGDPALAHQPNEYVSDITT